jgi:preprotein translocase subunit SecG
MNAVLVALHVIVCIFLIAVVLVQRGKGAEVGAVFGGGASSTVFGSRGAGNFLTKLTTVSAVIFMCTSLTLSYIATQRSSERLFEDEVEAEAPAAEPLFEELGTVAPESAAAAPAAAPEPTEAAPEAATEAAPAQPAPETPAASPEAPRP